MEGYAPPRNLLQEWEEAVKREETCTTREERRAAHREVMLAWARLQDNG